MREYCTTQKHLLEMNLKLLFVALIQQNWSVALTYRPTVVVPPSTDDPAAQAVDALLNAVVGLAQLNLGHYRSAAEKFLSVNSVYIAATEIAGINFQRRVIAPSEIAIYGSLCALATMSVAELQSSVLENQQFREFMDLELDLGRAVSLFCGHRFTDCLAALDEYSAEYKMDLHLRNHFAALYSQIRSKSMARWFSVFSVVSFNTVQSVFPTKDGASLQEELEDMIESGKLNARIDVVDQVSRSKPALMFY
jgi:COP9 signalosome complex subunit 1